MGSVTNIVIAWVHIKKISLFRRYFIAFVYPVTQIYHAATFTAKRAPFIVGPKVCGFLAVRTGKGFSHRIQQCNSNSTEFLVCTGRSAVESCLRKRTVNRCLPPLISGKYVEPCGITTRTI